MILRRKTEEAARSSHCGSTVRPSAEAMTSAQGRPLGLMPRALIDAGLNIYGDLQTDGEVEVDGKIVGNIGCTHLTIGKGAAVTGNIRADEVLVRGKVKGTIRATRVILQDSAQVEGDIYHDRIVIEDGARFVGASNNKTETTELIDKLQDVAAEKSQDVETDMHSMAS